MSAAPPRPSSGTPEARQFRQLLIHTICPHIKQWSDAEDVRKIGCEKCPATVTTSQGEGVQMCRLNAEAAADAILAILPPTPQAQAGETLDATEQGFLEDNIATVAHHLRQDGACLEIDHREIGKVGLIVKPGEVLREIARRLGVAQGAQEPQIDLLAKRIAGAELNYRTSYQVNGAGHIETGRKWDKMRKAGDAIRQYFFEREEAADDCACGGGDLSGHDAACPYYSIPSTQRVCAKCGCETKGEEALVSGEIWCHPCADTVAVPSTDRGNP